MSPSPDAVAALKGGWAGVTDRASLDHPALNVPASDLIAVLRELKARHAFDMRADVSGVDWGVGAKPRFTVVYHLYSTTDHGYFRVAVDCADDAAPEVPSATGLWPAADWHEREAYDMFGIRFSGHPDLRRILMWDGFKDHPMRRDYVSPDDFDYEPTPHDEVLARVQARQAAELEATSGQEGVPQ